MDSSSQDSYTTDSSGLSSGSVTAQGGSFLPPPPEHPTSWALEQFNMQHPDREQFPLLGKKQKPKTEEKKN